MEEFICDDDFNIFPNQMEVEYDFDINLISNLQEINQMIPNNNNQFYSQNLVPQPLSQCSSFFQSPNYSFTQPHLNQV